MLKNLFLFFYNISQFKNKKNLYLKVILCIKVRLKFNKNKLSKGLLFDSLPYLENFILKKMFCQINTSQLIRNLLDIFSSLSY